MSAETELSALRETLHSIGVIVGVTADSPPGERSVVVAVHAMKCREDALRATCAKIGAVMGCACKTQPICVGCLARNALPSVTQTRNVKE